MQEEKVRVESIDELELPSRSQRLLGEGSYASVKLVFHKRLKRWFALKQINLNKDVQRLNKDKRLELVKREIRLHKKLEHPNIIRLYDYFKMKDKIFLLMELADNGNLYRLINKNAQSEEDAIKYFYQVMAGIEYLHSKNVIHRDLKPENILITKENKLKICDFGWSVAQENEFRSTFCGTYEYMAPEIIQNNGYDDKVDVWSLGILLYELLHGFSPFRGAQMMDVFENIKKGVIKFREGISEPCKHLVRCILQRNPMHRIPIDKIKLHPAVLKYVPLHTAQRSQNSTPRTSQQRSQHHILSRQQSIQEKIPQQMISPITKEKPPIVPIERKKSASISRKASRIQISDDKSILPNHEMTPNGNLSQINKNSFQSVVSTKNNNPILGIQSNNYINPQPQMKMPQTNRERSPIQERRVLKSHHRRVQSYNNHRSKSSANNEPSMIQEPDRSIKMTHHRTQSNLNFINKEQMNTLANQNLSPTGAVYALKTPARTYDLRGASPGFMEYLKRKDNRQMKSSNRSFSNIGINSHQNVASGARIAQDQIKKASFQEYHSDNTQNKLHKSPSNLPIPNTGLSKKVDLLGQMLNNIQATSENHNNILKNKSTRVNTTYTYGAYPLNNRSINRSNTPIRRHDAENVPVRYALAQKTPQNFQNRARREQQMDTSQTNIQTSFTRIRGQSYDLNSSKRVVYNYNQGGSSRNLGQTPKQHYSSRSHLLKEEPNKNHSFANQVQLKNPSVMNNMSNIIGSFKQSFNKKRILSLRSSGKKKQPNFYLKENYNGLAINQQNTSQTSSFIQSQTCGAKKGIKIVGDVSNPLQNSTRLFKRTVLGEKSINNNILSQGYFSKRSNAMMSSDHVQTPLTPMGGMMPRLSDENYFSGGPSTLRTQGSLNPDKYNQKLSKLQIHSLDNPNVEKKYYLWRSQQFGQQLQPSNNQIILALLHLIQISGDQNLRNLNKFNSICLFFCRENEKQNDMTLPSVDDLFKSDWVGKPYYQWLFYSYTLRRLL